MNNFNHLPLIQDEPAFFAERERLFSDNGDRSWVEFFAAKEKQSEDSRDFETPREIPPGVVPEAWPKKITEVGKLWDIA